MHYMFFSTNDVFECEEILVNNKIAFKIVPTPVKGSVYCGVCIWSNEEESMVFKMFSEYEFETDKCKDN